MANNTKSNSSTNTKSNSDAKQIKEMKKTIEELSKMVTFLMSQNNNVNNNAVNTTDRDVLFISLCNHTLNLSTEPNGSGDIYTFTHFGEEQNIPYYDARKIIKSNKSFIKGGKCYIADDDIVASEHLQDDYKKILSKKSLLELLTSDRNTFENIFNNMTEMQKNIFKDIIVEKLIKNKNSVDMNIVQYVGDSLNVDIMNDVKYNKELLIQE